MKIIKTNGINYIEPVPYGTAEWYFGAGYYNGDLYETEEAVSDGKEIKGDDLCLIHYPDGSVYRPLPQKSGTAYAQPVYLDGKIYILRVDFYEKLIQIFGFDCESKETAPVAGLPLESVKNCYNLSLDIAPLTLTRQSSADEEFEIIWPERISFKKDGRETFFLRDGDRLYFDAWNETEDGEELDDTLIVRNLQGNEIERYTGSSQMMPNGEMWILR